MKMVLKSQGKVIAEQEINSIPSTREKVEFRDKYLTEGGLVEILFSSKEEELRAIEAKFLNN